MAMHAGELLSFDMLCIDVIRPTFCAHNLTKSFGNRTTQSFELVCDTIEHNNDNTQHIKTSCMWRGLKMQYVSVMLLMFFV